MKNLYIPTMVAAATIAATSCSPSPTESKRAAKSDDPNVILILIDDLSYFGTSAYGLESISANLGGGKVVTDTVSTPTFDRLAREGVLFNHAYTHALSEATRIALMTGMNNGRNFVHCKALHESQITFADVFKHNGYATGMYGKWKQSRGTVTTPGEKYISEFGWDDYASYDVLGEYQLYINPYLVVNDKVENYNGRTDLDPRTGRRWFGPDIFNYKALDFIEANKDNPFFLYYPMGLVHSEHRPMPNSKDGSFDTVTEDKSYNHREYYTDMIRYTDQLIGNVVAKVEELGLRENTLIVVMGDNGSQTFTFNMKDGSKHIGAKGQTKYSGEQVPMLFSMPGTIPTAGEGEMRKYDAMTDLTDIYPTILEAAGIEDYNSDQIDGISMWGQMTGKEKENHRDIIYKWYNKNNSMDDQSLLTRYAYNQDFKYYAPHDIYPKGRFFDLRTDPLEMVGPKGTALGFGHFWHDGLDIDNLTDEQQAAYEMLKAVVDANEYVKVDKVEILGDKSDIHLGVGESTVLNHAITPANATLNNVIWSSSNDEVVDINKFGEMIAKKPGEVTITLYSWDDARPAATGSQAGGYNTKGMKDTIKVVVE